MSLQLKFYEDLREKIKVSDVVRQRVNLTKKAGEYIGLCPFHNEKSPSFTVNDVKRFYHCFGCAAHGDVIKFISSLSGFSYKDAAVKLANDFNVEIPKLSKAQEKIYEESNELYDILQKASEFFHSSLDDKALSYLKLRQIDDKVIKEFNIGFAPGGKKLINYFQSLSIPIVKLFNAGLVNKNQDGAIYEVFHDRIIFPIKNIYNKVIGFGGRVLDNSMPKYINSPETIIFKKNEALYGEDTAISAAHKKNYIFLVEGYLDVIAMQKSGFSECVASLGTSVTINHLNKLWKFCDEIILCLDGDAAGVKASKRVIDLALPLISYEKKISFIKLPAGLDPDDTIKKHGNDFFINLIKNRINLSQMIWELEYGSSAVVTPEDKALLQSNLDSYASKLTDKTLSYNYSKFFKDQAWNILFKNKKNNSINDNKGDLTKQAASEIESLEGAICSILIMRPQILKLKSAKDFIINAHFSSDVLSDFKWWFIEKFDNIDNVDENCVKNEIEKTRFYDINTLLLKLNNLSFNIYSNKQIDYNLLFEILSKKYYLALLKQECELAVQNNAAGHIEKINIYRKEIIKISDEILILNESFQTKH